MDVSQSILSDLTVYMKYARFIPDLKRREVWKEIVDRNKGMHIEKFPQLREEIEEAYKLVYDRKVLPSMRSLQFGGRPIELNNARIYNCSFLPIDDYRSFSEAMFLLLSGCGVGFSVQLHHVEKLPEVKVPTKSKRFLVSDSIEGWADAVKVLCKAYFTGGTLPKFDFRDVRPKGALLITSGGKAPGPEPLKECLFQIQKIFDRKSTGDKLTSLECHDIVCFLADAVLSGGIRRAALISLFNLDDEDMLTCKFGNWWEQNPQRGRANNSAVILRHKITEEEFFKLWKKIELSGSGEPGMYFSNDKDWGTNPSLRAGTKVITTNGIFNIEDLQDTEFFVKNLTGETSKAKCWLSGKDKQLYEITLQGNKKYHATPEHEWPVWNGKEYVKVQTKDLQKGYQFPTLKQDYLFNGTKGTIDEGFLLGWNIGDGWVTENKNGRNNIGFIFSPKDIESDIPNRILAFINRETSSNIQGTLNKQNCLEYTTDSVYLNNLFEEYGYKHKSRGLPEATWREGSEEFRKGLIDGMYSSDGGVENPKHGRAVNYYTVHSKLAEDLSELLGFYGIKSSIREYTRDLVAFGREYKEHTTYVVSVTDRESILHFAKLFNLTSKEKQKNLEDIVSKLVSSRYKAHVDSDKIAIIDIKLSDVVEDVWDISVYDSTHTFQISHCITGNCCEIALRPYQFCNLCEVNVSDIESQEDLEARVKAATLIGTLQASYSDFHYLRDIWKKTTEKDALLGIGMTGIGSGVILNYDLEKAAKVANQENARVAEILGINKAARVTTVKPSGTSSLVLGTSSGIHAWHNDYYIRTIRVGKNEAIYNYIAINHPELIEDDFFKPNIQAVISVPQKAPKGSILRTESALELLERVKKFNTEWVREGHRKGANTNNVSATISIKDPEWKEVGEWMWKYKETFNGLSVLPYDNGSYMQAPFQDCTEEKFEEMSKYLHAIDLKDIIEVEDNTDLTDQVACAGGQCSIE